MNWLLMVAAFYFLFAAWFLWSFSRAPRGHQDEQGFHFDEDDE